MKSAPSPSFFSIFGAVSAICIVHTGKGEREVDFPQNPKPADESAFDTFELVLLQNLWNMNYVRTIYSESVTDISVCFV